MQLQVNTIEISDGTLKHEVGQRVWWWENNLSDDDHQCPEWLT